MKNIYQSVQNLKAETGDYSSGVKTESPTSLMLVSRSQRRMKLPSLLMKLLRWISSLLYEIERSFRNTRIKMLILLLLWPVSKCRQLPVKEMLEKCLTHSCVRM